ncbi:citrate-proton symporter [Campylobacter jejuni]|uniref:Citrate-proton symporter n=1 Tax=Campylobacter jejuni TaxID=197 RepID=A0A431C3H7_CAMJU|nr:tricarballylate/proton symporter TcuC [Campylobacter jejuni]ECL3018651.1 MFS transporter [Campylobacter jejuni]RTI73804.1 citrate-proton symporter [Campylobacter jejuni]RTI83560.1 citrate-proton symporter [Campylobacter jejuni]RTJ03673.1 citrate-proton symporter [Campylobacter jejuni]RTJ48080.1 citrate-proton symporter [Campylobacter jejuni]
MSENQNNWKTIFRVSGGNFLEMYDFVVYGFYAQIISRIFFPSNNEYTSLILSFVVFGLGALMRPIGAIFLGSFMDKYGRKKGLMLTLSLMALGTLSIAFCPGYETIGIIAPIIVALGRLIQGFSAGGETGGVSIYLSEIAPKGKKGFYVSWQSGSQQISVVFAGVIGVLLYYILGEKLTVEWGWRIPFIIGCLIVPYILIIRKKLEESEEFKKEAHHHAQKKFIWMLASIIKHYKIILIGIGFLMMTTSIYHFITVYTPTYAGHILNFSKLESFGITAMVGISNFFFVIFSGFLSDKIGRKPILVTSSLLCIISAYPILHLATQNLNLTSLIFAELWLSFIYGMWNGSMMVALTEIVPSQVKTLSYSFSYALGIAIFGGFTPVVATWLIKNTGDRAIPGVWLSLIAFFSLVAVLAAYKKNKTNKENL